MKYEVGWLKYITELSGDIYTPHLLVICIV